MNHKHESYLIEDKCPNHHYDIHILPVQNSQNKNIIAFGEQYNDIPIQSQLLGADYAISQSCRFTCKFLSYILAHQCIRYDGNIFIAVDIYSDSDMYDSNNDFKRYCCLLEDWIKSMLYDETENTIECCKQLILLQYAPNVDCVDETDIHGFEIQNKLCDLVEKKKNKNAKILLQTMRDKNNDNKLTPFRELLNLCQDIKTEEITKEKQLPLFIHHFYPIKVKLMNDLINILRDIQFGLFIPDEVIIIISEFAIVSDNRMYYDTWYLQRNAKKSKNKLIELWDNLLFDSKHYSLTDNNQYGGSIDKIWIPSSYLLDNINNCLQNIINELRVNNIYHIYRQVIWRILLHVNSLNILFINDITDIDIGDDWLSAYKINVLYMDKLKWEEWKDISIHSNTKETFITVLMYVFYGNIFTSFYGLQRLLLINEYDINGGMISPISLLFVNKLQNRMDEIYPIIIPTENMIIKSILETMADDDGPPTMFSLFHPGLFDPLLKCYLIELMIMDGIDALVLTFAAYITLASKKLLNVYQRFNDKYIQNDLSLIEVTKELYSFKDVKSISKLYNKYRNEIIQKYSHKITLKSNQLIMSIDYREPPPTKENYT